MKKSLSRRLALNGLPLLPLSLIIAVTALAALTALADRTQIPSELLKPSHEACDVVLSMSSPKIPARIAEFKSRMTADSLKIFEHAQTVAARYKSPRTEAVHLALALIELDNQVALQGGGIINWVMSVGRAKGVSTPLVRGKLDAVRELKNLAESAAKADKPSETPAYSLDAFIALQYANIFAERMNSPLEPEHLVAGLSWEETGVGRILVNGGMGALEVSKVFEASGHKFSDSSLAGSGTQASAPAASTGSNSGTNSSSGSPRQQPGQKGTIKNGDDVYVRLQGLEAIREYAEDMNANVRDGKTKRPVGREDIVTKLAEEIVVDGSQGAILLGDEGIGKKSIFELLVHMVEDPVQQLGQKLAGARCFLLRNDKLAAGAKYVGQGGERVIDVAQAFADLRDGKLKLPGRDDRSTLETLLKAILPDGVDISALVREGKPIILFVPDIHLLLGENRSDKNNTDLLTRLMKALKDHKIALVGTSTLRDWRTVIGDNATADKYFAKIQVEAPKEHEVIQIVRYQAELLGKSQGVSFTDDAVQAAIQFSSRYLPGSPPKEPIDVLRRATAKALVTRGRATAKVAELETQFAVLEATDSSNTAKMAELRSAIESERAKQGLLDRAEILRLETNTLAALHKAVRDFESQRNPEAQALADSIKRDQIKPLEAKILALTAGEKIENSPILLTRQDIALAVAERANADLSTIIGTDHQRLLSLYNRLTSIVRGQSTALQQLFEIVQRTAPLSDQVVRRGKGTRFVVWADGPPGSGKSFTAETLANLLFGRKENFKRVNMPDIANPQQLRQFVDDLAYFAKNYRVGLVLLDEIEKGPMKLEVQAALLTIFNEGEVFTSWGEKVSLADVGFILTGNATSKAYTDPAGSLRHLYQTAFQSDPIALDRFMALGNDSLKALQREFSAFNAKSEKARKGERAPKNPILALVEKQIEFSPEQINMLADYMIREAAIDPLISRLDEIIDFQALELPFVEIIAGDAINKKISEFEINGIHLTVSYPAVQAISRLSVSAEQGARLVGHKVNDYIDGPVKSLYFNRLIGADGKVSVDFVEGQFVTTPAPLARITDFAGYRFDELENFRGLTIEISKTVKAGIHSATARVTYERTGSELTVLQETVIKAVTEFIEAARFTPGALLNKTLRVDLKPGTNDELVVGFGQAGRQ